MKKLSLMVACLGIISTATFGNITTVQQEVKKQKEQQAPKAKPAEQPKPQPVITATPEAPQQDPAIATPAKTEKKGNSKTTQAPAKEKASPRPANVVEKAESPKK